jgi:hypothetical protein
MTSVAQAIPGYTFGTADVAISPVTLHELDELNITVGFTEDDQRCLQLAGQVLRDQVRQIVEHWRSGIIAGIPNRTRHWHTPEGNAIPDYLARGNLRFQQCILDTCLPPYDQVWLDYQHEIAVRHTSLKTNQVDNVRSTPYLPLRDVILG